MCYWSDAAFDQTGRDGVLFGLVESHGDLSRLLAYQTHDGGRHWSPLAVPNLDVYRGRFQVGISNDGEVLLNLECKFYLTSDWGRSWKKSDPAQSPAEMCGEYGNPYTIRFVAGRRVWLRTYGGDVLYSDDDGLSWTLSSLRVRNRVIPNTRDEWVSFADEAHGLAIIDARVFATQDKGQHWVSLTDPTQRFSAVSCAAARCLLLSEGGDLSEVRFNK
jgi:photosystem II stability/assembly factor-like uncharacterized protein